MSHEIPTTGTCASCQVPAALTRPWPVEVPVPPTVVDGLVCDECHASLIRYATEVQPLLDGPPSPPPRDLVDAVETLPEADHGLWWQDKNLTLWRWSSSVGGWTCRAPVDVRSEPEWVEQAFPVEELRWLGPFTPVTPEGDPA